MTVASHICEQLAGWGIDRLFGVSGANIEFVFDAAVRHPKLEPVLSKHEAAAAMMAIGWQERSGLPGAVATTSGGAAFNIVAPLTEALSSEIPLLAFVGQSPAGRDGTGAFQDSSGVGTRVDAEAILSAVAVHCERVSDPARAPAALREAARAALEHRGPAVLLLPRDTQAGVCSRATAPLPGPRGGPDAAPPPPSQRVARRLDEAIESPYPPLVIAGRAALNPGARRELLRLADAWGAALAVAPDAKSAVASTHPRFLGVTGVMGHAEVIDYALSASHCVLAGTRLPDAAGHGLSEALAQATIVSLNDQPCFPGLAGHRDVHELPGPLASTLAALRRATRARGTAPEAIPPPGLPGSDPSEDEDPDEPLLSGAEAVGALAAVLEPGADVFIDAGNAGAFAVHHLPSDGRGLRSVVLGMGAMGHAFGAAIGACEYTGRRTYVVAGDGAFFMHGFEIHTAVERRLPITFLILNNNAHAMCRLREERLLGGASGLNVFSPARPAAGMRAMLPGLRAAEVSRKVELLDALARARASAGPVVVSVNTAADEQPPFWPLARAPREQEVAA